VLDQSTASLVNALKYDTIRRVDVYHVPISL